MTEILNTFLEVPFEHKEIAKANHCFFHKENKKWSINKHSENHDTMVNLFKIINLKNIYDNKDIYKLHGAKWNPQNKQWYTYKSNNVLSDYFEDEY